MFPTLISVHLFKRKISLYKNTVVNVTKRYSLFLFAGAINYHIEKKLKKSVLNKNNYESEDEDEYSDDGSICKYSDQIAAMSGGGYRVAMEYPNKEAALHSIECSINKISALIISDSKNYDKYAFFYQKMKKLLGSYYLLKD